MVLNVVVLSGVLLCGCFGMDYGEFGSLYGSVWVW